MNKPPGVRLPGGLQEEKISNSPKGREGKEKTNKFETMERQFKNRSEQIEWYAQQRGWEPLTEEDKVALDDAVRMITNLD